MLLTLVDSGYKFLWADIGSSGSSSDSGIFNTSALKASLESDDIGFPPAEPLPNDDRDIPYFFIGDDAFALRTWMMKPFAHRNMSDEERIFNYRLSRAAELSRTLSAYSPTDGGASLPPCNKTTKPSKR